MSLSWISWISRISQISRFSRKLNIPISLGILQCPESSLNVSELNIWNIWTFFEPSLNFPGNFLVTSPEPSLNLPWTFLELSLNFPWTFPEPSLNFPWTFLEPSLNLPWTFLEPSLNFPWTYAGPSLNLQSMWLTWWLLQFWPLKSFGRYLDGENDALEIELTETGGHPDSLTSVKVIDLITTAVLATGKLKKTRKIFSPDSLTHSHADF